jgi:hypothetical protein
MHKPVNTPLTAPGPVGEAVVLAGGPHTASRHRRLLELSEREPFARIHLTGMDFLDDPELPRPLPPTLPGTAGPVPVLTDMASTTLGSAVVLARRFAAEGAHPPPLTVITSDYHARRAGWLLRALLRGAPLRIVIAPDTSPPGVSPGRLQRAMRRGEKVSWIYCGPLGLALRVLPVRAAITLAAGVSACLRWMQAVRRDSRRRTR